MKRSTLSVHDAGELQNESRGIILWLTGWSMPDSIFDRLRKQLPEYLHVSVLYYAADCPEQMLRLTEDAVSTLLNDQAKGNAKPIQGALLAAGWSLGGLLALRLAASGVVDGLVLFGATAQFTRSKEEHDRGWADGYVRGMCRGIEKDREAVETNFRKLMFTEQEEKTGLADSLPPIGSWSLPALISGLQILRNVECLSQLPNINCPVLLIHGEEDKISPYNAALELKNHLSNAKLVAMPACGHVPFLGREQYLAEEWRRWRYDWQQN